MSITIFQSGGYAGERIQLKAIADNGLPAEKKTVLQSFFNRAVTFNATR